MTATFTIYSVITLLAIAADAFSGVAAIVRFKPILPQCSRQACRSRS